MKTLLRVAIAMLIAAPAWCGLPTWVPNNPAGAQIDYVQLESLPTENDYYGTPRLVVALKGDTNTYALSWKSDQQRVEYAHSLTEARANHIPVMLLVDPETQTFFSIRIGDSERPLALEGRVSQASPQAIGSVRFDLLGRNLTAKRAGAPGFKATSRP